MHTLALTLFFLACTMQALQGSVVQKMLLQPGNTLEGCEVQGTSVVDYLGAADIPSWLACVCLVAYLAVVHAVSYAALKATLRRERR